MGVYLTKAFTLLGYLPTWGSVSHKDVWNKGVSALLGCVLQRGILRNEDPYEGDFLSLKLLFPYPLSALFYWRKTSNNYFSDIHVTVHLVCILLVFRSGQYCIFETNCIPLAPLPSRVLDWLFFDLVFFRFVRECYSCPYLTDFVVSFCRDRWTERDNFFAVTRGPHAHVYSGGPICVHPRLVLVSTVSLHITSVYTCLHYWA